MVMQYYTPRGWITYASAVVDPLARTKHNVWRLLSTDRKKVLATGTYKKVLARERAIQYFKRKYGFTIVNTHLRKGRSVKTHRRALK